MAARNLVEVSQQQAPWLQASKVTASCILTFLPPPLVSRGSAVHLVSSLVLFSHMKEVRTEIRGDSPAGGWDRNSKGQK